MSKVKSPSNLAGRQKSKVNQEGIAALLTIVVVSATALIIAYSSSILGLGELDIGFTDQKGDEAFYVADGCAEEALRHLRLDADYIGETLNLGSGSCIITITGGGSNRTVVVIGTVDNYNRKIQIDLTLSGSDITISGWQERSD